MYFGGDALIRTRGAEIARRTPPIKTAMNIGVHVGGGTDAHRVMSYNPFVSLQWMIDGRTVAGTPTRDAMNCRAARKLCGSIPRQRLVHPRRWTRGALTAGRLAEPCGADEGLRQHPQRTRSAASNPSSPCWAAGSCMRPRHSRRWEEKAGK